jgi:hypothetical protein
MVAELEITEIICDSREAGRHPAREATSRLQTY